MPRTREEGIQYLLGVCDRAHADHTKRLVSYVLGYAQDPDVEAIDIAVRECELAWPEQRREFEVALRAWAHAFPQEPYQQVADDFRNRLLVASRELHQLAMEARR